MSLALGLGLAPAYADPIETYGYGLRVTARAAFVLFLLAYLARPLVDLFGTGRWLVRHRRYLGLAAAFSHTVHFGYVWLYVAADGTEVDPLTIVFGGLAFVAFWLLAATSNNTSVRVLGPWWKRLHRGGMHYIWFIFAYTWLGAALTVPWYWLFVAAALLALTVRISAHVRRRGTRGLAASPTSRSSA